MTDLELDFHPGRPGQIWQLPKARPGKATRSATASDEWSPRRRLAVFMLCVLGSWAIVLTPFLLYWYI